MFANRQDCRLGRRRRPQGRNQGWFRNPIDASIAGNQTIADEIDKLKQSVGAAAFASRGYSIDQPLAIAPRDIPNTFTDIAAGTILANLVTDAFRKATQADIGFTANGMMRASLTRRKTGVLTVCDVFAVAPLGAGVVDPTAGRVFGVSLPLIRCLAAERRPAVGRLRLHRGAGSLGPDQLVE